MQGKLGASRSSSHVFGRTGKHVLFVFSGGRRRGAGGVLVFLLFVGGHRFFGVGLSLRGICAFLALLPTVWGGLRGSQKEKGGVSGLSRFLELESLLFEPPPIGCSTLPNSIGLSLK